MSTTGYTRLPATGNYVKDLDGSGPYVYDGTTMTLAGTGGGGGGGGGDASAANQTTQITAEQAIQAGVGATGDAAATAGSTGSLSAKLRLMTTQLASVITNLGTVVLAAGSALIGKVGIDQTTPGTTNAVAPISGQAGVAGGAGAVGATVQRTTLASDDPLVAATGATGDAAATAGSTGSVSAKLRLMTTQLASVVTGLGAVVLAAGTALIGKVGIDQTTDGTTNKVNTGSGRSVRLSVTRPANQTPYTANDVVGATAAALTFASIGAANGHVFLTSIDLTHEVTALPAGMTSFRLHLYNATPPSALADNAAWDLSSGDLSNYLGYVDFGVIQDVGSNLYAQVDNVLKQTKCDASGNLYAYLVTSGGWTPGANSTVFDITLRSVNA
jgi:hypothetical protein